MDFSWLDLTTSGLQPSVQWHYEAFGFATHQLSLVGRWSFSAYSNSNLIAFSYKQFTLLGYFKPIQRGVCGAYTGMIKSITVILPISDWTVSVAWWEQTNAFCLSDKLLYYTPLCTVCVTRYLLVLGVVSGSNASSPTICATDDITYRAMACFCF